MGALTNWIGKAFGRVEGGRIQAPFAHVSVPTPGWIDMSWPLNWWQCGYNVLPDAQCSTVDACVWAYVRAIAQLPGVHRRRLSNAGFELVTTSALSRILRYPNDYQTRSDFLTHGVRSLLYKGNWYALALRNDRSEVSSLHWLNPDAVKMVSVPVEGQTQHEIFYQVGGGAGNPILNWEAITGDDRTFTIPKRDVLHIKLATPRNPLIGESWLTSLSYELANRGYMSYSQSQFFANAGRPSGVLSTDAEIPKQVVDEVKAAWREATSGSGVGGTPVLQRGFKFTPITMSNRDAQLVDALKLSDRQIAGLFGVPGVLVGVEDNKPFATTEALMNHWLAGALGYLIDHIETQIDQFFKLSGDAEADGDEWTEYDTEALLRTELQGRIEALARGVQGGIFAPNEARAKEGYKAAKAGDEPRVQQQVVPLSFALEPPAPPAAAPPPAAAGEDGEDEADDAKLFDIVALAKGQEGYEQSFAS